jgi:peptidyl-prolyl cis-trans isomerase SurA
MKKQLFAVIGLVLSSAVYSQQKDPVLLEINGKPVTKSEFLQIYLKNNNDPKFDKASLDEYMELFKKFKLKVAEAEAQRYDTIPKLKRELEGYKKQLALPYLVDSAKNEALVREAYDRTANEVRASHILIRVEPNASPADTLAAYNRLIALKKRIEKGEDFASVAKSKYGSDDPSAASNGGDVGFFTAFQMVYPFEEMAFTTPVGSISDPFRTRFGYHIVKVTDKRPARGTIKAAHIMVSAPKEASSEDIQNAEKKINELYDMLVNGSNFEELASDHSDDPSTSNKGGILPAFGTGTTTRMVSVFEDAAFALKNDGDFSKPVRTEYGFHIIKRLELKGVQNYEMMRKELQTKVNKDDRSKSTQASFVAKLKKEYAFKDASKKGLKWFDKNLDTTYFFGKWNAINMKGNKTLFVLDGKKFTQKDFAEYLVKNYRTVRRDEIKTVVATQHKLWEKEAILQHEEDKLPSKHPEYKALLTEYHDGILLYEIMQDMVWNKAIKDTIGLRTYFEANRSNYMWGKRVDAEIYECLNKEIATEVSKMLPGKDITSKEVIEKINKDSELNLRVRTNKYDLSTTNFLTGRDLKVGVNAPYEFEGKFYVIKVVEVIDPRTKEFHEAKGAATSDYQNELERIWLEQLKAKHKIKVNEEVLYSLGK